MKKTMLIFAVLAFVFAGIANAQEKAPVQKTEKMEMKQEAPTKAALATMKEHKCNDKCNAKDNKHCYMHSEKGHKCDKDCPMHKEMKHDMKPAEKKEAPKQEPLKKN